MKTNQDSASKIRLTVDVSQELNKTLESLAQASGSTKSDILRRALTLMEVAAKAKSEGKKMAVVDQSNSVITEIMGV
jgi:predicted transcriptional regulator